MDKMKSAVYNASYIAVNACCIIALEGDAVVSVSRI